MSNMFTDNEITHAHCSVSPLIQLNIKTRETNRFNTDALTTFAIPV